MLSWLKNFGRKRTASQPRSTVDVARDALMQSFEAYRLARRDRPREHYQPYGYSGDAAIISSQELMHRRVRDLQRNTAQAKRAISALVNLIVGTGIQTYSWPFSPSELFDISTELESLMDGELGPRLSYALESDDLFEQWANDPEQFDIEGRLNWPDVQRMLLRESASVGTGLLIRCYREDYKLVPLCYQLIESEQLDNSMDRPRSETGDYIENKILNGREFDENNRVVAYHIFEDHPQEFFGGNHSAMMGTGAVVGVGIRRKRIPAERVIDLTLFTRPSASVGVTWLDACGQSIWDRDSFMESEIRSAALDAVFALVAKLEDADQYDALGFDDGFDDNDEHGNREFKLGHSPIAAKIKPTEDISLVAPTRPNKDAPAFIRLLDGDIASAMGISLYSLTGDYTATNYTSAKAAKQDEDLNIRPLQNWMASHLALPVRQQFNAMAAASGLFKTITPAEFAANPDTYQRFDAIGNGRDLIDPKNEGEARTTRLRTCMSTFKEECARVGKHWIRVLMQIAVERRIASLFGFSFDFTKTGAGDATSDPAADATKEPEAQQQ